MAETFELKTISKQAIPEAVRKAEHYRLLNEPAMAESICYDILAVDPDNQKVIILLITSITDQFDSTANPGTAAARKHIVKLSGEFDRLYFGGIISEREARAFLARGGSYRDYAYDSFVDAMELYEQAEALSPPGNNNAMLRYNSCVRTIAAKQLEPAPPDERVLGIE